jgi:hypothetical protein
VRAAAHKKAIAMMMEAASTSEMSANFYQTTRRKNPEDSHLINLLLRNFLESGFKKDL